MVQINLLPVSEKKKRLRKVELEVEIKPFIFILCGLILAIMLLWVVLGVRLKTQQKQLALLDEQLNSAKTTLQRLDTVRREKQELTHKLEFLNKYLKREMLWAENLNRLSNLVPSGIWLKRLTLTTRRKDQFEQFDKLNIDGSVASLRGQDMIDLIGIFMTSLQEDQVLSKQLSEIKLLSSQQKRGTTGSLEIMDFRLSCQFR